MVNTAATLDGSALSPQLPDAENKTDPARIRHTIGNLALAAIFFAVLIPHAGAHQLHQWISEGRFDQVVASMVPRNGSSHGGRIADWVWLIGAALMGILSLVRVPPRSVMLSFTSLLTTGVMMIAPLFMAPTTSSEGVLAEAAIVVLLVGVVLSQVARLYLGRRFGLLPANRGIVSRGPFRLVRHPIYLGWFVMASGFLMAHPSWRNAGILLLTVIFMIWRIDLEEQLLTQDDAYRAYCATTTYRLIPLIY